MIRRHLAMLAAEIKKLEQAGLHRAEKIHATTGMIDFTRYDYLGFAHDDRVLSAARAALDEQGLGVGSPRVFTGTRSVHKELERTLARFLGFDDALVVGSGYLANICLYEALFDSRDCLFCDAMVHPSTAEGIRLSHATAFPFHNSDVEDLEDKLRRSRSARFRAIVTEGVFPFDGRVAELDGICALAERYEAMVVVDESLGVGVLGQTGRGTREHRNAMARVDVVTGTFSKSLGGAGGGFVAGRREVIDWLRQKATPYLFSVGLPPPLAAAALAAIELLDRGLAPLQTLRDRTAAMKQALVHRGLQVLGGEHPTLAVMVGGVVALQKLVDQLYEAGIHVSGLCYPVVPEGEARIRLEVSARHTEDEIERTATVLERGARALRLV